MANAKEKREKKDQCEAQPKVALPAQTAKLGLSAALSESSMEMSNANAERKKEL
jgi:hypothetical protein